MNTGGFQDETSLSIVIPAYNEANRIGPSLRKISTYCGGRRDLCEIIVVDDGSLDGTDLVLREAAEKNPLVRMIRQSSNTGKGCAVRQGILCAYGARIAFCDADLSSPIEELDQLIAHLDMGYDIAIGSRVHKVSGKRVVRGPLRRTMATVFNLLARGLLIRNIADTQCGLKAFNRAAARDLFARQTVTGLAFDVELLWRAQRSGYRIAEVPVSWVEDADSRIRPWSDSLAMARDVFVLWFRERIIPACRKAKS